MASARTPAAASFSHEFAVDVLARRLKACLGCRMLGAPELVDMDEAPVDDQRVGLRYAEMGLYAGEHLFDRDLDVVVAIALLIVAHVDAFGLPVPLLARGTAHPAATRRVATHTGSRRADNPRSTSLDRRASLRQSQSPDKYCLPLQ